MSDSEYSTPDANLAFHSSIRVQREFHPVVSLLVMMRLVGTLFCTLCELNLVLNLFSGLIRSKVQNYPKNIVLILAIGLYDSLGF